MNPQNNGNGSIFNVSSVRVQKQEPAQVQVNKPQSVAQVDSHRVTAAIGVTEEQKARWANQATLMQSAPGIANKINAIGAELKQTIVERNDLIDAILVALVTGNHVVMIGDPGIAKSMLAREICKRINGGNYFEWLLNKTSDPSEILGPFSIAEMENDHFKRITTGKLPEAHIAFLDEIFKSNEPTLNALLAITNERVFHNDGQAVPVPLISMFGASNEEPEDESLKALYDRMLFRFVVKPVSDANNRLKMYAGYINRRNPRSSSAPTSAVTIEELNDIRMASRYVVVPQDVLNQYDSILSDLNTNHQIKISDRRKNEGIGVIQGAAILSGRDTATVDDFRYLIPIWWQRVEDFKVISDVIMKIINPYEAKLKEERINVEQIIAKVNAAPDETQRANAAIEAKASLNNVVRSLDNLIRQAKSNGKDTKKIEELKLEVYQHQKSILNKNLGIDESILQGTGFGPTNGDI